MDKSKKHHIKHNYVSGIIVIGKGHLYERKNRLEETQAQ